MRAPSDRSPNDESRTSSWVLISVTFVIVAAAIAGVSYLVRIDHAPVTLSAPPPDLRVPSRPELPTTDNPELDRLLREAQESIRAAEESLHRAEDNDRRIQAELGEAIRKKAEADRAKAAAAMGDGPAMTPAPGGR